MSPVRAALVLAGKDLRQRLRDRSAIVVAVLVPFALAAIFSLALSDVASGDIRFEYALADDDGGEAARAFSDGLGSLEEDGIVELTPTRTPGDARRLVEEEGLDSAFVVPAGFSDAVVGGRPAELLVVGDVDAPIGTLVARSIAQGFAENLESVRAAVVAALAAGGENPVELAARAAELASPVRIEDRSAERKELELETFYAAGMAVFFLFFTVQFGVSSLLDERREGTLRRLLAAPIPRTSILGGKALTSLVLGAVSMTVLVVATSLLLGADWGSPLGVALLVAAGVVAATAVMTLVATLAKTTEQAGYWQAIVALVLGMLGGSFFPVGSTGGALEVVSLATPHAWFLRGLTELSGGAGVAAVLPATGAILAFAAVMATGALLRAGKLVAA